MNDTQLKLIDINKSFWVSAFAGSGKTTVLIYRIINLLLNDNKASSILCLTFSKAAALEMQARLSKIVDSITTKQDAINLLTLLQHNISESNINKALNLKNILKDSNVAMQTVHSYCYDFLLKKLDQENQEKTAINTFFNRFRLIEDFEIKDLQHKAFIETIKEPSLYQNIQDFLNLNTSATLFENLIDSIQHVDLNIFADDEVFNKRIDEIFEIEDSIIEPVFPDFPISVDKNILNELLATNLSIEQNILEVFLTKKDNSAKIRILTKAQQEKYQLLTNTKNITNELDSLGAYANSLSAYVKCKNRVDFIKKCKGFFLIQKQFYKYYQNLKQKNNLYDFQDLISKTIDIFNKDIFDELSYKIQFELKHLLVDEAQDTNLYQWYIIKVLVKAISMSDKQCSFFVVGDDKQSIYSFQGANVNYYREMFEYLKKYFNQLEQISLNTNYRSTKDILNFVDCVFKNHSQGVSNIEIIHQAFRTEKGIVENEQLIKQDDESMPDWPIFTDYKDNIENQDNINAKQIVEKIESIVTGAYKKILTKDISYKDIMILFRSRTALLDALQTELDKKNIPYTTAGKQNLLDDLLVKDFLSVLKYYLNPLDDLNLACLLNTSFIKNIQYITIDDMFSLCHTRQGHLEETIFINEKYLKIQEVLNSIKNIDGNSFQIIQKLYNIFNNFDNRLDILIENLYKQLFHLKIGLNELIYKVENEEINFSQNLNNINDDCLKILTIHASKGLESPVVLVIDDSKIPSLNLDSILYDDKCNFYFLKPNKEIDTISSDELKNKQNTLVYNEYKRLLYVALTRARDALVFFKNPDNQTVDKISKDNNNKANWSEMTTLI